jgi:inosine-uridine nucleoside N-ribohydrolase
MELKLPGRHELNLRDNGTMKSRWFKEGGLVLAALLITAALAAQTSRAAQNQIIIDTDIGDDIDDAFAVTLALQSPELRILGFTTTYGDTEARARLLRRLLVETGHPDLPVAAGPSTPHSLRMTQIHYAERGPAPRPGEPDAITFLAQQISAHPGQITLVAIGPLTTVEAMLDREPEVFRQLKQVVLMGGSIDRGYGQPFPDPADGPAHGPDAEWNIINDISGARKLFASGVPVIVMPLDATELPLDEVKRGVLFAHGSPVTDALTLLYHQWGQQTPTLFDAMTVTYLLQPQICPVEPIRIRVDDKGYTRREPGPPNAKVCLHADRDAFFDLLLTRLLAPFPTEY